MLVFSRSLLIKVFLFAFATLFLAYCASQTTQNTVTPADLNLPKGFTPPPVTKLTGVGTNSQATLSPKGNLMAFISEMRPNHENPQIYILDLGSGEERRVTYQDGVTSHVTFSPDGRRIVYSSTTDEAKEDSNFIKESLEKLTGKERKEEKPTFFWENQPTEIYSSFINGSRIERLTHIKHYDAEATIDPKDHSIIFVSARDKFLNLHVMSTTGVYLKKLTFSKTPKAQPVLSPNGQYLAWVEYNNDFTSAHIFVGNASAKKPKQITSGEGIHFQPTWLPDNQTLIFSSNRDDKSNYELYSIKRDGSCLQRLTWHTGNETEPSASKSGNDYVFTSDRSGEKQIYKSTYKTAEECNNI
ncbi:MAG: PD40 domain-containing protein [Bdellovibrionales bacterium]|nr:PD40 domain-containing protein [Bdellovibrionales bacterium]